MTFSVPLALACAALALWAVLDARRRRWAGGWRWAPAIFVLPYFTLPVYLVMRPLRPGEARAGGRPWRILKGLALGWLLFFYLFSWYVAPPWFRQLDPLVALCTWLLAALGMLLLGAWLRRPGLVERGPAGSSRTPVPNIRG